jgi:hypothetical protein
MFVDAGVSHQPAPPTLPAQNGSIPALLATPFSGSGGNAMKDYKGISSQDKQNIVAALKAKGAGPCPRCSDSQWTVSEYSRIEVQATIDRASGERATIPTIMIVCQHCGFISQHALQPLGLWHHDGLEFGDAASPPRVSGTA